MRYGKEGRSMRASRFSFSTNTKNAKDIVRILILLMALPCFAPPALHALIQGTVILEAGKWIGSTLLGYAVGKGIDKMLGTDYEEELEQLEAALLREIRKENGDMEKMRAELKAVRSELQILDALLRSQLTPQDVTAFRQQLARDLEEVLRVQEEHDRRISSLERQVNQLTRDLRELKSNIGPGSKIAEEEGNSRGATSATTPPPRLPATRHSPPPAQVSIFQPGELRTVTVRVSHGTFDLKLRYIPKGEFTMGSPEAESRRGDNEGPQHKVTITRDFWMAETEVTQAQWQAVMGNNPSRFAQCGAACPVEQVSWNTAVEFTERLSELTGQAFRLPTEGEWEYATRAGTSTRWSFGDSVRQLGRYSWYAGNTGTTHTHPVGEKAPNHWNLCDMHGNVVEWTLSWYTPDYSGREGGVRHDPSDPTSPDLVAAAASHGVGRVTRGGGFSNPADSAADRYRWAPSFKNTNLGFRVMQPSASEEP